MPPFEVADAVNSQPASTLPVMPPSTILARLRLETRAEHEAVERVLDLMSVSMTRDGLRRRLQQFYGFYAPLEDALRARSQRAAKGEGEAQWSVHTHRALALRLHKTACLHEDLRHLGVTADDLPLCSDLPPLDTEAQVLGCVYVLEGATLGGRMITQHVQASLGITPDAGGRFFDGYGADTGRMWQSTRQWLVSGAVDLQSENTMVASAIATFACLRRWCESAPTDPEAPQATRHARKN